MKKNRINYLLQKYIQSKLTPEESAELHEALKDKDHEADFDDL